MNAQLKIFLYRGFRFSATVSIFQRSATKERRLSARFDYSFKVPIFLHLL
jgi:hypothetical protein